MAKRDQMGLPIAAATDKLDKTKPVCFEDKPGCDADLIRHGMGKTPLNSEDYPECCSPILPASGMRSTAYGASSIFESTPGIPYPEPGETNQFDAERTEIRWSVFALVVRYICTTGLAIYLFHLLKPLIR